MAEQCGIHALGLSLLWRGRHAARRRHFPLREPRAGRLPAGPRGAGRGLLHRDHAHGPAHQSHARLRPTPLAHGRLPGHGTPRPGGLHRGSAKHRRPALGGFAAVGGQLPLLGLPAAPSKVPWRSGAERFVKHTPDLRDPQHLTAQGFAIVAVSPASCADLLARCRTGFKHSAAQTRPRPEKELQSQRAVSQLPPRAR